MEGMLTYMFLKSEDDGLEIRESGDWAKEKLSILQRCISMFTTSMRNKPWTALNYIDLEAGPGKNRIRETGDVVFGSPLLGLQFPFDNYFFVERDRDTFESLEARVSHSPRSKQVRTYHADCNKAIGDIIDEINQIDAGKQRDQWRSLNLAFVDPEGLEIHWNTLELLGQKTRTDLIINVSTSTIVRMIKQLSQSAKETAIDDFFGTREWRDIYEQLPIRREGTIVRRYFLDFYADRLSSLGYLTTAPNGEYVVLNSRNRQLYSLICASKDPLGIKFFDVAANKFKQAGLPGFH